jgi:hypothetical protein
MCRLGQRPAPRPAGNRAARGPPSPACVPNWAAASSHEAQSARRAGAGPLSGRRDGRRTETGGGQRGLRGRGGALRTCDAKDEASARPAKSPCRGAAPLCGLLPRGRHRTLAAQGWDPLFSGGGARGMLVARGASGCVGGCQLEPRALLGECPRSRRAAACAAGQGRQRGRRRGGAARPPGWMRGGFKCFGGPSQPAANAVAAAATHGRARQGARGGVGRGTARRLV